jgi:hypothetical protein
MNFDYEKLTTQTAPFYVKATLLKRFVQMISDYLGSLTMLFKIYCHEFGGVRDL